MNSINTKEFKEKIFNYSENKTWKFEGTRSAIVDFSASWCGPCKMIAPILEELSEQYKDQIDVYKVDIDENPDLTGALGIRGVPTMLIIPVNGEPKRIVGAVPKNKIEEAIKNILL